MKSAMNSTCCSMKTGPLVKAVGAVILADVSNRNTEPTLRTINHKHVWAPTRKYSKMRPYSVLPPLLHINSVLPFQTHTRQTARHAIIPRRKHDNIEVPFLAILRPDAIFREFCNRRPPERHNFDVFLVETLIIILLETTSLRPT